MPRLAVEHLSWGAGEYDTVKAARFSALVFGARGIVPFAYAAFAFTLGVVAGLLLRRPVAAMAVTLAIYAVMLGLSWAVKRWLAGPAWNAGR